MNIDRQRLKADLRATARECRDVKDVLGATWTRPMKEEQQRLARLRLRATELCVLAAWLRGRRHVRHVTALRRTDEELETWHAAVAARVAKEYASPGEAAIGATS